MQQATSGWSSQEQTLKITDALQSDVFLTMHAHKNLHVGQTR